MIKDIPMTEERWQNAMKKRNSYDAHVRQLNGQKYMIHEFVRVAIQKLEDNPNSDIIFSLHQDLQFLQSALEAYAKENHFEL